MRISLASPPNPQSLQGDGLHGGIDQRHIHIISNIAHYVAGVTHQSQFCLFNNGGRPLLERRPDDWIQEIVFRSHVEPGDPRPAVRLEYHLSHAGVQEIRRRFWRPASRAPMSVAHGNIGDLQLPPRFMYWLTEGEPGDLIDIADYVFGTVRPWFDSCLDEFEIVDRLLGPGMAGMGHDAAIEVLLALNRRRDAQLYVRRYFAEDEAFWRLVAHIDDVSLLRMEYADSRVRTAVLVRSYALG